MVVVHIELTIKGPARRIDSSKSSKEKAQLTISRIRMYLETSSVMKAGMTKTSGVLCDGRRRVLCGV
jgi:hypothetical protein